MSYYALTDSDWAWDDEAEGRALVVRAGTPEEAVKIATEKHIAEFPGAGGICWKVARLWNLGFGMVDWEDDNKPKYDGFNYYPDGCNGPMDKPVNPEPLGSIGGESRGYLARLRSLIADAEADIAQDYADAETTGERPDLHDNEITLSLEDAKALEAALSAQVQDVPSQDGWQLVPKNPTPEMITAARFYATDKWTRDGHGLALAELYRDMLAAAPAAKLEGKP